jgi:hypothetical protein
MLWDSGTDIPRLSNEGSWRDCDLSLDKNLDTGDCNESCDARRRGLDFTKGNSGGENAAGTDQVVMEDEKDMALGDSSPSAVSMAAG